jgi:uncharacterized protein with FMN-binding domain
VRRAVIAIAGTIAGLVALLGYKSGSAPDRVAAGPGSSLPADTAPPTTSTTSRSTRRPATPTTAAAPRSIIGTDVPNKFGDVQVRVVVQGGHITDVQAIQLPSDRRRSAYLSQVAEPRLRLEVLNAQSSRIQVVSGATYTSRSYAESVQSALDRA